MYTSECLHVNIYTNKSVHEVPNISCTLRCRQVIKTAQQDVIKKSISCKASEQVGFQCGQVDILIC